MPFALPYTLPTVLPGPPEGSPAPTRSARGGAAGTLHALTSHCASARALILQQYKESPRLLALLCSYVDRVQEIEDGLVALYEVGLDVERAEGDALDLLGRVVREARDGRADYEYRRAVRTRILVNRSQGRREDLIAIARTFEGASAGGVVRVREYQPARVHVLIEHPSVNLPAQVDRMLRRAKAAGVALQTITLPTAPSATRAFRLAWATTDKTNETEGLGWTGDSRGGHLGHARA